MQEDTTKARDWTAAVIVAAGGSTRMGTPKQQIPLCGIPVLARTMMAFEAAEQIDEMVLVTRPEDRAALEMLAQEYGIAKLRAVVPGGQTRQESAANGAAAVGAQTDYIAVHDGARPLIRPTVIDAVVSAARKWGAATAAVPVKDTIKRADDQGCIIETPDRRRLWSVQTPQVFEAGLYRRALKQAEIDGVDLTDDCQLVERLGESVRLVEADYANLKITTPEDVAFAEAILRERGERF